MFGNMGEEVQAQTSAAPAQSWWQKTISNIGAAVGSVAPAVTALIQQKTAEKVGEAQAYQMQMTAAANSPAVRPDTTAKKVASWVVPPAVGGALLVGGILLMRKRK